MIKLKKTAKKEEPKVEAESDKKAEITYALNKVVLFTERRCSATTPERLKECDFWIAHFKKVAEDLNK